MTNIFFSPALIHSFYGGRRTEERKIYYSFLWSFPPLVPDRGIQNKSLSITVFVFLPSRDLTLPAQDKREGGSRSCSQLTILLPIVAFLLCFLAEECCFLAFGVSQLLGIQNICGFKKIILEIASVLRPWGWKCQALPKWNTWQLSSASCVGRQTWGKRSQAPRVEGPPSILSQS